jgi:hypothetical protein
MTRMKVNIALLAIIAIPIVCKSESRLKFIFQWIYDQNFDVFPFQKSIRVTVGFYIKKNAINIRSKKQLMS